jgi:hypothetical protein
MLRKAQKGHKGIMSKPECFNETQERSHAIQNKAVCDCLPTAHFVVHNFEVIHQFL